MSEALPIDVIVPAYNGATYLFDSLGSIVAQTRGVREVIVVDDGSTDETAEIARSFGARVISQPNAGIAAARNTGIRASSAPYIALLDVDDRWHPERLEHQWRVHVARPEIAIIATDYTLWQGDRVSDPALALHATFASAEREMIFPDAFIVGAASMLEAIAVKNFVLPSSMLLDRRIFDDDGVYYHVREHFVEGEDTFVGEDLEWLLRALVVAKIAFVDRPLVDYRQTATSLSARRGRIRYGDVVLGKMIARSPASYVPGAAQAYERNRSRALRESAIAHARVGEFAFAAARLRELGTCAPQPERSIATIAAIALAVPFFRSALSALVRLRPYVVRVLRKMARTRGGTSSARGNNTAAQPTPETRTK